MLVAKKIRDAGVVVDAEAPGNTEAVRAADVISRYVAADDDLRSLVEFFVRVPTRIGHGIALVVPAHARTSIRRRT
jgi:hypothetical protein